MATYYALFTRVFTGIFAIILLLSTHSLSAQTVHRSHAIAMHGEPLYQADFTHFDYVNPDAPKGGALKRHVIGSFDSLNPFVAKGRSAAGMGATDNSHLYDSLTVRGEDEPFTQYGLLAKTIEWPEDRSWVRYHLHEQARFSDGHPVRAEDVAWTFNTLTEKGRPFYSYYYAEVERVEIDSPLSVTFYFTENSINKELPLIIGQLPILPKHYWEKHDFEKSGLLTPLGSGPYVISNVEPGKNITYRLRDDYWAKALPVMRGRNNFGTISYDYYLDNNVALEAFKSGHYDWRHENTAKLWATAYQGPAFDKGEITTKTVTHHNPWGAQGFFYNLRNPLFQDIALRQAITYAFDFEWSNSNLFHGQYKRNRSYFENSDMAATGLPSEAELKVLDPFRDQLPETVFNREYQPPKSDGSGRPRANLREAQQILKTAGYQFRDGALLSPNGAAVNFDIMLSSPAFERVALPFARNLKALGITANVITIDATQYVERIRNFDFDMVVGRVGQSSSPGNEQKEYWGSDAAQRPNSRNLMGIQNPVIDALIDQIIAAPNRDALVTRCRALDRVLQWQHYAVLHWYTDQHRIAYQSRLRHPNFAKYVPADTSLDTWWDSTAQ